MKIIIEFLKIFNSMLRNDDKHYKIKILKTSEAERPLRRAMRIIRGRKRV